MQWKILRGVASLAVAAQLACLPIAASAQDFSSYRNLIGGIPAAYLERVQKTYIAYYGRPADGMGLAFWAGLLAQGQSTDSTIIDEFGNSPEYQARYQGLSNEALVNSLFINTLGREADPAGLEFYVSKLQSGEPGWSLASIALRIIDGVAPGSVDEKVLANRLLVSDVFTATVYQQWDVIGFTGEGLYSGIFAIEAARALLLSVTEDPVTIAEALPPLFLDRDGDGYPDALDPDVDGDGVLNVDDLCNDSLSGESVDPQGC